jgi:hypothetical protein
LRMAPKMARAPPTPAAGSRKARVVVAGEDAGSFANARLGLCSRPAFHKQPFAGAAVSNRNPRARSCAAADVDQGRCEGALWRLGVGAIGAVMYSGRNMHGSVNSAPERASEGVILACAHQSGILSQHADLIFPRRLL